MKIITKYLSLGLSVLLLSLTGCGNDNEEQKENLIPVKIYSVQPESLKEYLNITGTISAANDQILYSKISERIDQILVKPGDLVKTNQIIARQYNALLSQSVDVAKANLKNTEAQFELAQQNYNRIQRLFEQRAVSQQQFDQAATQFKVANSALDAASAQLEQAIEQLDNSLIKAPFSGIAAAVFVELNQMVSAGQQIAQIVDPSSMKSKLKVISRDIKYVKKGLPVEIVIPSIPDKKYKGKIISVDQAVDPLSKSLEIEVLITNTDNNLKSGLYGEFMIPVNEIDNTVVVPETALLSQTEVKINKGTGMQETLKKYFLFIVQDDKAKIKEVTVGLISNSRAQITSGINFNDKVIIVGNNIVRDDQKVQIID
ncbi:MAG: efflux RND transporter periplasmic adaptor subunit [Ignavibacteriaceae bacterium]|jgi:membrane fusion protein (multidrug efflux system)|nr:efflux RND transporter periplasmic adaptor subunit [Ignavibacteriaceae bacterium]GIK21829.1 MAG: MexH family multidrug efflux RND transporter periplasmic adaptor subunit [Ignavibacteriota bacterium]